MNAKEKAEDLTRRFWIDGMRDAKDCALICIEEEMQGIINFQEHDDIGHYWFFDDRLKELEEIKKEIIKI